MRQQRKAGCGDEHHGPDVGAAQQRRAQRHLQQVQEDEWVADAPAQIQLHGEHGHVHQQRQKQLHIAHAAAGAPAHEAHRVVEHQATHHHEHLAQGQGKLQHVVRHLDGEHLAHHGDPAQLDELVQVFQPGRGIGRACLQGGRGGGGGGGGGCGHRERKVARRRSS